MLGKQLDLKWKVILGILSAVLFVGGYAWLSHRQHVKNPDDTTIPNSKQLLEGVKKAFEVNPRTEERWIVVDTKATFSRLFLGLAIGVFGSVTLGLLMGCFQSAEAFLVRFLTFLSKIPPTAALAVFFVMVGTDTEMYVTMIAFGVLPTLAQAVYLSVKDIPKENLFKALTLGASKGELIWNVVFSQIRPKLIDAIRLQIGPAMVYLIAAEMVCSDVGFGYRIRLQSRLLDMKVVYPYLLILAGFGLIIDQLLKALTRRWCPWYEGKR